MESVGERIRKLRLSNDLTLGELGKSIGVARQTINKYENGTIADIPLSKINALSKTLNTTPSFLLGFDDEPDVDTKDDIFVKLLIQKTLDKKIEWVDSKEIKKKINKENIKSKKNSMFAFFKNANYEDFKDNYNFVQVTKIEDFFIMFCYNTHSENSYISYCPDFDPEQGGGININDAKFIDNNKYLKKLKNAIEETGKVQLDRLIEKIEML